MNKINFITILLTVFLVQLSTSKDLFTISHLDNDNYLLIKDMYPDVNVELIKDSILFLQLNQDLLKNIINKDVYNFEIEFPFFNQSVFNLKLDLFSIAPNDLFITRHTDEGTISSVYETGIKTYRIIMYSGGTMKGPTATGKRNTVKILRGARGDFAKTFWTWPKKPIW